MKKRKFLLSVGLSSILALSLLVTLQLTGVLAYPSQSQGLADIGVNSPKGEVLGVSTTSDSCYSSNSSLNSIVIANQNTNFTATFDVTPTKQSTYALIGFSQSKTESFDDMSAIIRLNDSNTIDARNGDSYSSTSKVTYVAGTTYHFHLDINLKAQTYSAYVNTANNAALTVAKDYSFRNQNSKSTNIGYLDLWDDFGEIGICNLTVTPVPANTVTVQVTSPKTASITSPVLFTATANSKDRITGFVIYANQKEVYKGNVSSLNTSVAMDPGTYKVYIRAWDNTGAFGTSPTFDLVVGVPVSDQPVIPANAMASSNIQTADGWHWNHDAGTPGTAQGTSSIVSSPSLSGNARKFDSKYTSSGGEIYSTAFTHDAASTNFVYDAWVWIASGSKVANLEMDSNQVTANGHTVIYAFQCDGYSKTWDYSGAGAHWVKSTQSCDLSKWSTNTWHHVQISYSRDDSGDVTYHAVWLDGKKQSIEATVPSSFALGWGKNILQTQFQLDGLGDNGSSTVYVDNLTIYHW